MIKWGIIAPGAIANAFAKEINNTGNGKLIAVYGRNSEKVKDFANKYNIEKYYDNIDKFLQDDEIEAVYIATPHNYHMEYAIKCIEAKKSILCEKPFSYNYETSSKVLELAKINNVFVMEALWTMFLPAINKVKEWIKEDKIGKLKLITANFGFKGEDDINSRLFNPNLAGGALLDVGIYTLLLSNFINENSPIEVNAVATMTKTNVDETTLINLKYEDGMTASLTCSIAADTDNTAIIYGEKGKIVIPKFWMAKEACLECIGYNENYKEEYEGAGYKHEIIAANNSIINGELENSVATHKVTLQLAKLMDEIRTQINLVYPFENYKE